MSGVYANGCYMYRRSKCHRVAPFRILWLGSETDVAFPKHLIDQPVQAEELHRHPMKEMLAR
jgi:hypothetical protein